MLDTLIRTPVLLLIHAVIQAGCHVAAGLGKKKNIADADKEPFAIKHQNRENKHGPSDFKRGIKCLSPGVF